MCLSDNHLLPVARSKQCGAFQFIPAKELTTEDTIYIMDGVERVREERITSITPEKKLGLFAPLTMNGTVVVDGVAASCYAEVRDHEIMHLWQLWLRGAYQMGLLAQTNEMGLFAQTDQI